MYFFLMSISRVINKGLFCPVVILQIKCDSESSRVTILEFDIKKRKEMWVSYQKLPYYGQEVAILQNRKLSRY